MNRIFSLSIIKFFVLIAFLLANSTDVKAQVGVPPAMILTFSNPSNTLSYDDGLPPSILNAGSTIDTMLASSDVPSQDFKIYGRILSNCPNGLCIGDIISFNVSYVGTFGGGILADWFLTIDNEQDNINTLVSTAPTNVGMPNPLLPWVSNFEIIGDIRETSVRANTPVGSYDNTMVIRIVMM